MNLVQIGVQLNKNGGNHGKSKTSLGISTNSSKDIYRCSGSNRCYILFSKLKNNERWLI